MVNSDDIHPYKDVLIVKTTKGMDGDYDVTIPVYGLSNSLQAQCHIGDQPTDTRKVADTGSPQTLTARITLRMKSGVDLPAKIEIINGLIEQLVDPKAISAQESADIGVYLSQGHGVELSRDVEIPPREVVPSEPSFHPLDDPIADRSGPLDTEQYVSPTTVRLQRTPRALTGDVALWLLIKMNADMLGWDNYVKQIDSLFFPDANTPLGKDGEPFLYGGAARLSRRRFPVSYTHLRAHET